MLIFAPTEQKLHVFSDELIAHAFLADALGSLTQTQCVLLWCVQMEKHCKPKAGPFWIHSTVTQILHLKKNRIETSPVSSTSTLVEHGGVVGK